MLVVDAGFSFTHIVPIMGGAVLWSAVKRCVDFLAVAVHLYESMQDRCWWEAPDKSS
jgi:actin-related protein 6